MAAPMRGWILAGGLAIASLALPAQAQAQTISTVAGGGVGDGAVATGASLFYATGVALDSGGNLYIVEQDSGRIRKVAAGTGIITTVAGNGVFGFSGDGEIGRAHV